MCYASTASVADVRVSEYHARPHQSAHFLFDAATWELVKDAMPTSKPGPPMPGQIGTFDGAEVFVGSCPCIPPDEPAPCVACGGCPDAVTMMGRLEPVAWFERHSDGCPLDGYDLNVAPGATDE